MHMFELDAPFFEAIQSECLQLIRNADSSRVQDPAHVTHWVRPKGEVRQYSLFNVSGRPEDTSPDHNFSCRNKHFSEPDRYPSLALLIRSMPHCVNFRMSVLAPGACLSVHKETVCFLAEQGAIGMKLRFHLPVITNDGAEVVLENNIYHFDAGHIYFFNQGCIHGARNQGHADRIHLIWDMLLTNSTAELMFGEAEPPFPATRSARSGRPFVAIRHEAQGPCARMQPVVSPATIKRVAIVEPQ